MCNGLETGQCIQEWCAACEWPAERPAQLREWLDCVRDLSVADEADIGTIASSVSTWFLGKKAFRERVRVLAARIKRGEDSYDRAPAKRAAAPPKRAAAPPPKKPAKKKPPAKATKRKAPSPEPSSSESESESERPPRRAAAKAAAKKAPPAAKKKKPPAPKRTAPAPKKTMQKKKTKVYADKDLLLRPTYVAKAAAEFEGQSKPKTTKGRCARCDGLHRTEACPHFSKPRERVVQASVSSTRVAAVRTGIAGKLEQVVVDDAPGRPPQLPGSAKGEARPAYPFTAPAARGGLEYTRAASLNVAPENPKVVGSAAFDRYERYKAAKTVGAYLDAGGTRSDLRGDWDKGYVTQASPVNNGDDTDDDFDELYSEVAAAPAPAPAADDWGSASFGMAAPAPAAPAPPPAAAPAAADDDDWGAASFGIAPAPAAADDACFTISLSVKTPAPPAVIVTPPAPPAAHPLAPVEPPAPPPAPYVDADDWGTASFGMNTVPTARVVSAEVPANGDWGTVCPVPLTVRGTQVLVGFAPLAPSVFCAARQNAVLRRSPLRRT